MQSSEQSLCNKCKKFMCDNNQWVLVNVWICVKIANLFQSIPYDRKTGYTIILNVSAMNAFKCTFNRTNVTDYSVTFTVNGSCKFTIIPHASGDGTSLLFITIQVFMFLALILSASANYMLLVIIIYPAFVVVYCLYTLLFFSTHIFLMLYD